MLVIATFGTCPSVVRLSAWDGSRCGIVRNGRDARLVSHVKMLPLAWPPAIVVWSADIAMAVIEPDSTATYRQQREHL